MRTTATPVPFSDLGPGDRYREAIDPRGKTYRAGSVDCAPNYEVLRAYEFDYAAAWEDNVLPAWEALAPHVRAVFDTVSHMVRNIPQDSACRVPMPGRVLLEFDKLTIREVAELSAIAERIEHLKPSHAADLGLGNFGAGWRVSNVADQWLALKLGFRCDRFHRTDNGHSLRIHGGQFRAQYGSNRSHPDGEFWIWQDVGLATMENRTAARTCAGPVRLSSWEKRAEAVREALAVGEALASMLDPLQAYAPKGYGRYDCRECNHGRIWADGSPTNHEAGCSVGVRLIRERTLAKLEARDGVEVTIECHGEQDDPRGHFASGDDEVDRETVDRILADLDSGNDWAWCSVHVVARFEGFEGDAWLGGCNYSGERDFRSSDYFADMKAEALDALLIELGRGAAALKKVMGTRG